MKKHSSIALAGGFGLGALAILVVVLLSSLWEGEGSAAPLSPLAGVLREAQAQAAAPAQEGAAPEDASAPQPIAFPHNRHVTEFQIDCQYCHFAAERSMSAGIPTVTTCMGCHAFIPGSQNPDEVTKLRGYAERQEAIPWNRIYKVADHVQFPHMRHISAGVQCTNCHGNVPEIGVIAQVAQPLTMGWCVNCHIASGASRDCTACHY